MQIVLGVTGGVAAYKAALILRSLKANGHAVRVVPTRAASRFIGETTWEALSEQPVHTDVFTGTAQVEHVEIGRHAELVLVAPATADFIARAAAGLADDLLTTVLLTATCPVVIAPAMHSQMWLNPATQANVATLRRYGYTVMEPADGALSSGDSGPGRLADPERIVAQALASCGDRDLDGVDVVVSAGGTQEPLDPVRFLGNRSSGKQGTAIARVAAARGAHVTLVLANVDSPPAIPGVRVEHVGTALELEAMMRRLVLDEHADIAVMAAAVADFRPADAAESKIKRAGIQTLTLELVPNPDILRGLVADAENDQLIVGFAAETGDEHHSAHDYGTAKARDKGAALTIVNDVSRGRVFGQDTNSGIIVDRQGQEVTEFRDLSKDRVAGIIMDEAAKLLLARLGSWRA